MFARSTAIARRALSAMIVAAAMFASVILGAALLHAQPICESRDHLIEKLDRGFGEQPIAIGLASTGDLLEVLVSRDGTWTILVTSPQGVACVAATGEFWQMVDPSKLAGETS